MNIVWILILILLSDNSLVAMQKIVVKPGIVNSKSDIIERIIKHYEILIELGKKPKKACEIAIKESPFVTPEKIKNAFGSFETARGILREYRQANVELYGEHQRPTKKERSLASLLLHCFPIQSVEIKKIRRQARLFDELSLRLYDQDQRYLAQTPRLIRQQSLPPQGSPRMQIRSRSHSVIEIEKK